MRVIDEEYLVNFLRISSGRDVWNAWAKQSKGAMSDFSETDLSRFDFSGFVFPGAVTFCQSQFSGDARFDNAIFYGPVSFRKTYFRKTACFRNCTFWRSADFSDSKFFADAYFDLSEAMDATDRVSFENCTVFGNLSLRGFKIAGGLYCSEAEVGGDIDLEYARVGTERNCKLTDVKLSGVLYLHGASIQHLSHSKNIVVFRNPQQLYPTCFVSFSAKDLKFAQRLYSDLTAKGVECFFAPDSLKIGDAFRKRLDVEIYQREKVILVLSADSISSQWVEKEVETTLERERQQRTELIMPVRLDDAVMNCSFGWAADIRRSRNIGDFTKWRRETRYQASFGRLLKDLRVEKR